jgi:hypothetical protein
VDDLVNELSGGRDEVNISAFVDILDFFAAHFLQARDQTTSGSASQSEDKLGPVVEAFFTQLSHLNDHILTLLSSGASHGDFQVGSNI